jgi:D-lactate dehydrogenase
MKIGYVTPYQGEKEIVQTQLNTHEVIFHDQPIETHVPESLQDVSALSIFVDSKLTEDMIDAMPHLQVIALRSTGFDHVPVSYARSKGIRLAYVPHYGSQTVAEHTFALLLSLSRQPYPMYSSLRSDGVVDVDGFEGFDLAGKTLGVVGTGAIGRRVIEIAQGFRMNVIAHDLYPDHEYANKRDVTYLDFFDLLPEVDVLTFHVPATPENHHMLDAAALERIKPGAYVINTARGTLVDTVSLLHAIKKGHIAGAGLDVYEGEAYVKEELKLLDPGQSFGVETFRTYVAEQELLDMPNVIMTPHMAFNTTEAKREITDTTIGNITSGIDGEPNFAVPE